MVSVKIYVPGVRFLKVKVAVSESPSSGLIDVVAPSGPVKVNVAPDKGLPRSSVLLIFRSNGFK